MKSGVLSLRRSASEKTSIQDKEKRQTESGCFKNI
ncbi:hypothetical protein Cal6303_4402 [Calothrix sp. PCC 6303]|nr:hypothetical protein Cal6303_4402 [Calothrix sp. PCC 6303]